MGKLGWPFWTKLVVVTVGLTGGIVFMYIQCKQYLNLCARWRSRNRILLIQNAPEKIVPHHSQSPAIAQNSHQSSMEPHGGANNNNNNQVSVHRNDSSILVISAPPLNNNAMINSEIMNQNSAQPQQHIVANIENNYELDDDISCSNISFKHHLRHNDAECTSSRGSLHNIYDNTSISTTNTSATTRNMTAGDNDSNFHRIQEELTGKEFDSEGRKIATANSRYNNDDAKLGTSMFIENSDILNDKNYPRLSHHHSQFLLPSSISPRFAEAVDARQKERRRYSDTKLLQNTASSTCDFENEFLINKTALFGEPTRSEDMIFERCDDIFDPIDLNIQNILEMDMQTNRTKSDEEQNN